MNIKLITLTAAVAFATAMAQDYSEDASLVSQDQPTQAEAPAPAPAPVPAPAPATPAPAAAAPTTTPATDSVTSETPKANRIHGIAYNRVGNQAADATIRDNLNKPYKMAGSKLVYMEPTSTFSTVAFGNGNTKFISFEMNQGLGLATAGIANKLMGISLSYALSKELEFTKTRDAYEMESEDNYTVNAGDILRLRFAMQLGALDLNASAFWLTYQNETSSSEEFKDSDTKTTTDVENDFWDLGGKVSVSNDPSAKKTFWNAGVTFTRHENAYERERKSGSTSAKTDTTGKDAHVYIQPEFNIGGTILQGNRARVLLGLNTRAPLKFYDEFDDDTRKNKDSYFTMGVYAVPNIFAEIKLGNCWKVFAGANFFWTVFAMEDEEFITDYNDELEIVKSNATQITMRTGTTNVDIGARFQYNNFAVEASIENTFYSNPFGGFADENYNIIANIGGFIYF